MITLFELHFRDRLCFVIVSALKCHYCFSSVVLMKILFYFVFSHKNLFWFTGLFRKKYVLGLKSVGFSRSELCVFTINTRCFMH